MAAAKKRRRRKPVGRSGKNYRPLTAADVTDERLLVGEFRSFRNEMRSAVDILTNKLLPMFERYEARFDGHDHLHRQAALEREQLRKEVAAVRRDLESLRTNVSALDERTKGPTS